MGHRALGEQVPHLLALALCLHAGLGQSWVSAAGTEVARG